jgi:putative transcriptional regulator
VTTLVQAGQLLVATPPLVDPNFDRTVVLLLEHTGLGSLGVVLNRPSSLAVPDSLERWRPALATPAELFTGGPVEPDGVIGLALTAEGQLLTIDLTEDPADVGLPGGSLRLFRGYAGWGPGQLDDELDAGAWLVVPLDAADAYSAEPNGLWRQVLARQGGRIAWLAEFPDDVRAN